MYEIARRKRIINLHNKAAQLFRQAAAVCKRCVTSSFLSRPWPALSKSSLSIEEEEAEDKSFMND